MADSFSFKIVATSLTARYREGEFQFNDTLPLPERCYGLAGHNEAVIKTEDPDIRAGLQGIFEIGATYEITIRKVE